MSKYQTPEEIQHLAEILSRVGSSIQETIEEDGIALDSDMRNAMDDDDFRDAVHETIGHKIREDETLENAFARIVNRAYNTSQYLLQVSDALDRLAKKREDEEAGA